VRSFFFVISFLLVALLAGFLLTRYSPAFLMLGVAVVIIFTVSFIIVRIMEPFWFFVGIIAVIPMLARQKADRSQEAEVTGRAAPVRYVSTAR
jgi:hypothetical protein